MSNNNIKDNVKEIKMIVVEKITSMLVDDSLIINSTCNSKIITYKKGTFLFNRKVSRFPITGMCLLKDKVYFSTFGWGDRFRKYSENIE